MTFSEENGKRETGETGGAPPAGSGGSAARPRRRVPFWLAILAALLVGAALPLPLREMIWQRGGGEMSEEDHAAMGHAPARSGERKILYWHDPMHPQYRSDRPGKAPDCGMDLVPVYEGEEEGAAPSDLPPGAFPISAEKQQLIGVRLGEAHWMPLSRTLRTVGRLAYDESRIVRVHSKVSGWIETVHADFTGKWVRKGQPLLTVYSPELVATQEEYLLALKASEKLGGSPVGTIAAGAGSLLEAARKRLELWDIPASQIEELEKTRRSVKASTIYAPASGFILERGAWPGQRISPETELYALADLSNIWVIADIYEQDAPEVRLGQAVSVTLPYAPGRTFRGRITYVYPQFDDATRTLKVRAELSNPGFTLKPDMYADVEVRMDYGRRLVVPDEAVLDSGPEKIVFVALEGGYFEPRRVQIGPRLEGMAVILDGLSEGERIVTSGNFLVDSESRLRLAASGGAHAGMDHSSHGMAPPPEPKKSTAKPDEMDHSQHQMTPGTEKKPAPKAPEMDHSQHQHHPPEQGAPKKSDRKNPEPPPHD